MTTLGFDDEILMILPFLMVPLQLYMMLKILKNTPYIVRDSLKRFVVKYSVCMVSLMSIECVKVLLIIYGSGMPEYYTYHHDDGFASLRYAYHIME
jgi:hypothetical protein